MIELRSIFKIINKIYLSTIYSLLLLYLYMISIQRERLSPLLAINLDSAVSHPKIMTYMTGPYFALILHIVIIFSELFPRGPLSSHNI
jgi:hypothetical protein